LRTAVSEFRSTPRQSAYACLIVWQSIGEALLSKSGLTMDTQRVHIQRSTLSSTPRALSGAR